MPLSASAAKALAAAGMQFACRYLVPANYAWKRLTRPEAEAISAAGMTIISVYETAANRPAGGAAAGANDGAAAYKEAVAIGQPAGSAIYFAVDYDARSADYDAIEAYLKAAAAQIGPYKAGVYGSYTVIEEMAGRGAAAHFWQTYAWSRGRRSGRVNIFQYKNGQTVAGVQVDLNDSYGNEGGWSTVTFNDVPGNSPAKEAIELVSDLGLMQGYGDGTFKPNQPVTRAELAIVLARLAAMINKGS
ncbi:glycoside hydrolase domain-containing protein [Paenibacillus beijingensis]|uniref:glycoside hydrolase domain-containing protein n=1 Tax=Paenibacillus beijingensis TaxID=1126833 RepID=UPI0009E61DCC|nr:glycoside hydrolase domain-containing protein [Paenibacillus beijingensis]